MKKFALILSLLFVSISLLAQSVLVTANLPGRNVKSEYLRIPEYDFSESGIKAAAVTAFAMTFGSALPTSQPQPTIIKLDHPFLFLIRDKNNGTIWFLGTVYQPNLWSDDASSYHI